MPDPVQRYIAGNRERKRPDGADFGAIGGNRNQQASVGLLQQLIDGGP